MSRLRTNALVGCAKTLSPGGESQHGGCSVRNFQSVVLTLLGFESTPLPGEGFMLHCKGMTPEQIKQAVAIAGGEVELMQYVLGRTPITMELLDSLSQVVTGQRLAFEAQVIRPYMDDGSEFLDVTLTQDGDIQTQSSIAK